MDKIGSIEIRITGSRGNLEISPDNYDIRDIRDILENTEDLLFPGEKQNRPTISYSIADGSVRHIFKTSIQYIIGFNAVIGQINQDKSIDFLDAASAKAFEKMQDNARQKDLSFTIKTSLPDTNEIVISKATILKRTEAIWADAEFYFYGKITNAGGKDKASIHISTEDRGILRIQTPINFLEQYEQNLLYKIFGIRAAGKQHSETGEIDTTTLKFIELIEFQPTYDEKYLKTLRDKAKNSWLKNINPDTWLRDIRGDYDA